MEKGARSLENSSQGSVASCPFLRPDFKDFKNFKVLKVGSEGELETWNFELGTIPNPSLLQYYYLSHNNIW